MIPSESIISQIAQGDLTVWNVITDHDTFEELGGSSPDHTMVTVSEVLISVRADVKCLAHITVPAGYILTGNAGDIDMFGPGINPSDPDRICRMIEDDLRDSVGEREHPCLLQAIHAAVQDAVDDDISKWTGLVVSVNRAELHATDKGPSIMVKMDIEITESK